MFIWLIRLMAKANAKKLSYRGAVRTFCVTRRPCCLAPFGIVGCPSLTQSRDRFIGASIKVNISIYSVLRSSVETLPPQSSVQPRFRGTKLRRLITPVSISPLFQSCRKGGNMQDGSVTVERRKRGPDVWSFRWREGGPDGRKIHRRIVLGTADDLKSIASARNAVVGLRREINLNDVRIKRESIKLADLSRHFQQRETDPNFRIALVLNRTRVLAEQ